MKVVSSGDGDGNEERQNKMPKSISFLYSFRLIIVITRVI